MEDAERIWVEKAIAGDRTAFANLVAAYQNPVYNLAYRMLGNSVEAEDAAQETFIRAYTHLKTYDPCRKFSSWLLAIASHYCVDVLRRKRLNLLSMDDLPPMVELSMPSALQPEQAVIREQNADDVQEMLNSLHPSYRTPIVLRYWYDMSYKEIAETTGLSLNTVKTRLHRARHMLARALEDKTACAAEPLAS